jgi:dTDP-glucose 4,6-dehydratase
MIEYVPDRLGHDRRYSLDSAKLRDLGWKSEPRRSFEQDLRGTVSWYRDHRWWWEKLKER